MATCVSCLPERTRRERQGPITDEDEARLAALLGGDVSVTIGEVRANLITEPAARLRLLEHNARDYEERVVEAVQQEITPIAVRADAVGNLLRELRPGLEDVAVAKTRTQ